MKTKKKWLMLGALTMSVVMLSACDSDEEKSIKEKKKSFQPIYSYDYDETRVIVEKKKSPQDLAKEMMLENVGLDTKVQRYAKKGVEKDQGVFLESAVRDGDKIPKVSAMSKQDIEALKQKDDGFEEKKKQTFEKLKEQRQAVLSKQYEDDKVDVQNFEKELKKKAEEQTKKIAEQEKAKAKQDAKKTADSVEESVKKEK
ncbi:hypothetical protein [Bacillus thuringiensis]|uniref:hypothetical protein n=1 Tax=Bacillus thuringiensis TaxID=1428 RepID=UPI000BFBD791|nr:hypothetical protein [Bacillus thuringiensis]PGT89931.1 hypothetical protein COD17_09280 [Bacillus thuringiensis]